MTNSPIVHKYHFADRREDIFSKLEWLLQQKHLVKISQNGQYSYIAGQVKYNQNSNDICNICIASLQSGVVIHTSYPGQADVHPRLWMLSGFIGDITYIEISNPNLRHYLNFDPSNPTGNTYELHAGPYDLDLLEALLNSLVAEINQGQFNPLTQLNPQLLRMLPA